ncbi:hypothetical protein ACFO4O_02845 [Glaciecola siphonariae]|uniref:Uncharacterized protein n=1 Tax=Glaciecola siphonariae TaxID=521012 RepID=A0ABV9LS49_9ALTE
MNNIMSEPSKAAGAVNMTLMTIEDFRARPCTFEYLMLYLASSSFIIMLAATLFGQISGIWMVGNTVFFAACGAFLLQCRYKRHARAAQFYQQWLQGLSNQEIEELKHRLRPQSRETHIVSALT